MGMAGPGDLVQRPGEAAHAAACASLHGPPAAAAPGRPAGEAGWARGSGKVRTAIEPLLLLVPGGPIGVRRQPLRLAGRHGRLPRDARARPRQRLPPPRLPAAPPPGSPGASGRGQAVHGRAAANAQRGLSRRIRRRRRPALPLPPAWVTRTGSGPGPAPRRPGHGLRGAARPGPAPGLPSPPSRPGTDRALPLTAPVLSPLSRGALREPPSLPLATFCSRWSLCSPASLDARRSPRQGSPAAWRSPQESFCLSPEAGLG